MAVLYSTQMPSWYTNPSYYDRPPRITARTTQALRLLEQIAKKRMTSEEATIAAELEHAKCPWKRISDLKTWGYVAPARRQNSQTLTRKSSSGIEVTVYQITDKGREALRTWRAAKRAAAKAA